MATTSTSTSTATAARPFTTTTTTPPRPQPPHPIPHPHNHVYTSQNLPIRPQTQIPNSSTQQQGGGGGGILYPVASSGRGFIPRPARPQDQTVTVANNNPGAYHPRAYRPTTIASSPRAHPQFDQHSHSQHMMRQHPTQSYHQHQHQHHYVGAPPIKGVPVPAGQPKVAPSPSPVSDSNGYKNLRSRDDTSFIIRDRKVRISDAASLYVLCRSWLRNGLPEESQPHNGDVIKSLPRPLPIPVIDTHSPKKEGEEEVEDEEDEESVADLSTEDLLKRHINRAKKVRARLREGRLKRIERYKTRLALLLPPQASTQN